MTHPIDTLAKAVRRGMLLRSECRRCGNVRLYRASDLMMLFGGGRDPLTIRFRCASCAPDVAVTLIEIDIDRARGAIVHAPFWRDGKVEAWMPTRLK